MPDTNERLSRRGFLGLGVFGASASALAACSQNEPNETQEDTSEVVPAIVEFDGEHQAGIETPAQENNTTVAFELKDGVGQKEIKRLLRIWTADARSMTAGKPALADLEPELYTNPGNLTITCGFGEGFYRKAGIAAKAPEWLKPLPAFKGDALEDDWGQRDLVLQICGDDQTTVSHALRVLVRGGADYATPSWTQTGFLNFPVAANGTRETARNLFGFKDGTVNPHTPQEFQNQVWNSDGGTAMIVRRIAFNMPLWEALDRPSRETVMGRTIVEGSPLSGGDEFTPIDLTKRGDDGLTLIDAHSHVAQAATRNGDQERLQRRAYNYDIPSATPDSGLIFTCFQKDPRTSFIPIQKRLSEGDRLMEWITHVGSAVFHVPRGTTENSYWGEELFA